MKKVKDAIPTLATAGIFASITDPLWSSKLNAADPFSFGELSW